MSGRNGRWLVADCSSRVLGCRLQQAGQSREVPLCPLPRVLAEDRRCRPKACSTRLAPQRAGRTAAAVACGAASIGWPLAAGNWHLVSAASWAGFALLFTHLPLPI